MTVQTLPAQYPDWATAPAPGDVTESDAARKASGWLYLDRPPHDEFNWWWQRVAQWVRYTEERLPWGWWPSAVLSHGGVNVSGAGTGVDVGAGEIVVAGRVLHRNATPTGAITPDGVWYGYYDVDGTLLRSLTSADAFAPGRVPVYEATVAAGLVTRLISLLRVFQDHERFRPLTVGPSGLAQFRTLREACLYARSHLGTKRHEILLVGDIAEPDVLDSSVLGSGTTIRAAVWDPATTRAPRVTWAHDGPLFDLAGVDGLTLDNLEALKTVGAGPSDDDVMILIDGSVTGLRLIRCIVPSGGAQAMRGVLAVKSGGDLVDLEVRGGKWGPTDHAVRLENGGLASHWLLDGTWMRAPGAAVGAFPDGIILDPTASSDVDGVQLRGLRVEAFDGDCLKLAGEGVQVQQGYCSPSAGQKGIYFLGTAIRAEAIGVHVFDGDVGVRVDTGADHTRIEGCHIESPTGRGIHIGADNVALVGNTVRESGLVAIDSAGTRGTIVGNVASWAAPPVNGIDLAGGNNRAVVGNSINGTAIVNAGGADVVANNT